MSPEDQGSRGRRVRRRAIIALALTVVSAVPRFYHLGHLSFWGDEDLTVLSARGVLEGKGARMPTGMPYRRALPFTWANALSASLLGPNRESSYRVVAAATGSLTPAALYLTGTAFVSPPVALVAASMLALSEWHIVFSRYGRMYAPFLLFFLVTAFLLWQWVRTGSLLLLGAGVVSWALTLSLHLLGLLVIQFPLIALVVPGAVEVAPWIVLGVTAVLAGGGWFLQQWLIQRPYAVWSLPPGFPLGGSAAPAVKGAHPPGWIPALVIAGAVAGGWLGLRIVRARRLPTTAAFAVFAGAVLAGICAFNGYLWGATMAVILLLVTRPIPPASVKRIGGIPGPLLLAAGIAWAAIALSTLGLHDGIRRIGKFPFPYVALLWSQFPVAILLFAGTVVWASLRRDVDSASGLAAAVLATLLPMAGLGLVSGGGATRYVLLAYPYLLLCAAAALVYLCGLVSRLWVRRARTLTGSRLALLVVAAGVIGGHGIPSAIAAATLEHGEPVNEDMYQLPFPPDHKVPGEYVRAHLRPGDVVIAEDPLVQRVYVGRVDYWLRAESDARAALYLAPDGVPRDIYAGSALLPTAASVQRVITGAHGRVWLITSGETVQKRDWYLSSDQAAWLAGVEARLRPEVVGRDGVTEAYCLNCPGTHRSGS